MMVDVVVKVKYRVEAASEGDALARVDQHERLTLTPVVAQGYQLRTRQVVSLDAVEVRP